MQRQVFRKILQAKESLEGRSLHPRRVGEAHVIFNERENLTRFIVGETKAPADLGTDGDADFHVSVKADTVGSFAKGRGLANVVQQRAPRQRQVTACLQLLKKHERVDPHVALGMILRRLRHALHP